MRVALTICSANYLPQVKTLADSFLAHNPGYQFVVGLVDEVDREVYASLMQGYEVLPVAQIGITDLTGMTTRYTIMELNTAVKPFYLQYLFRRNQDVDSIVYLDPDIFVFGKFSEIEEALATNTIVLTPHILVPLNDSLIPDEVHFLMAGVYNLGFIALSRHEETMRFLEWWQARVKDQCFFAIGDGFFVDQLWITLAPIFFEGVYIEKHPGYNMAYWNLKERVLSEKEGVWYVNEQHRLIFYHYSRYDIRNPEVISPHQNRYGFKQRQDLVKIFDLYREKLIENKFYEFCDIACSYMRLKPNKFRSAGYWKDLGLLLTPPLILRVINSCKRYGKERNGLVGKK